VIKNGALAATNSFGIDGKFQFLDTGALNYPTRFYRSATP